MGGLKLGITNSGFILSKGFNVLIKFWFYIKQGVFQVLIKFWFYIKQGVFQVLIKFWFYIKQGVFQVLIKFWFYIKQGGVRCLDCGFSAHLKCSEKSRPDCRPEAKYIKRMFAVDLTTLCLAHNVRVPTPLLNCIDEIERRGINTEGIYRVSGSFERIDKLRRLYDLSHNVDLRLEEDIHTVAGLLKLYLRLLPQQLVPFSVFRALLKSYTNSIDHLERIRNCRNALDELNEANKDTLRTLLTHLRKIASNSNENKMSAENLSTIFSPTIFCTGNFPFPVLPNQQHVLLNFLITNKNILGPC